MVYAKTRNRRQQKVIFICYLALVNIKLYVYIYDYVSSEWNFIQVITLARINRLPYVYSN